jgi:Cdc6-like AAA superfamily ATPase
MKEYVIRPIDTIGLAVLLGVVGLFAVSVRFDRLWWTRFWRRVSSMLDPLRARHWTLGPVVSIVVLVIIGVAAKVTRSIPVAVLWVVLFGMTVTWFLRARYQNRRYRKSLRDGFAVNMDIWEIGGNLGRLDRWAGSVRLPKRSILVAGAPGSGKTEAAKHLVQQMLFDNSSLILVYDHKTDFQEFFDELEIDYIRISMEGSTQKWNLFQEISSAHDIDEFAQALFPELSGGENDFFDDMARQVFAACLKRMIRENGNSTKGLTNATVRRYFQKNGADDIYEDLHQYSNLRAAASAINVEKSPRQAQGVYASIQRVVNKIFVGDFGESPNKGDGFSIRNHVRDPQGVPIVLDFPKASGQSTKPIFRFLIDHAAMFAMQDTDNQSYFVLDEFAQIPHLRRLEELVNVGRGEKVTTLVTLQSVQQLYQNYERAGGESILAGLVSMILLRPNDAETVDFYQAAIGKEFSGIMSSSRTRWFGTNQQENLSSSESRNLFRKRERSTSGSEKHHFSEGEIRKWDPGIGVVVKQSGWTHGYISMLTEMDINVITNVLDTSESEQKDALPERERNIEGELESRDVASADDERRDDYLND